MPAVVIALILILSILAGSYLQGTILMLISIACITQGIYMARTLKEIAVLFTIYFVVLATIGNVLMWGVYLWNNKSAEISHWFHTYILQ
ncbi:MAG: hypothetical protein NTX72_02995 [Candidatus Uhrbacteria bacterium]|nr:hypothetical protein [Candidatus Uhrbacteria bacterium]